MRNENVFMARKGAHGALPTGRHAPKPKRKFKEHNGLSKKERKSQRGQANLARRNASLPAHHSWAWEDLIWRLFR